MQLREIRKAQNLTMKQVSERSDISESMLSLIESGKRTPSVRAAQRLAAALGVEWTKFFETSPTSQV